MHTQMLLWIAVGGSAGAVGRYLLSGWVHRFLEKPFPWGTLVVNVVGSWLMGVLFHLLTERFILSPELRSAVLVGFLGSLTTFSTFSMETWHFIETGTWNMALLNIVGSVILSLSAVWLGLWCARIL